MSTTAPLKKLKVEAARSFLRDVTNENDFFYVFFGRSIPWRDENNPPAVTDDRSTDAEAHTNIIFVKRITANDVVYLIPNNVWDSTGSTIYDRYTDEADLSTLNFYVYNPDNKCIYKCLNRKDYIDGSLPVPSTTIPSDPTGTEKFMTEDGYWWKMVYRIPDADVEKFMDKNNPISYLPIRFTPSSTEFDTKAHIGAIRVDASGNGYRTAPPVVITGDGKGAYATATINTYGEVVSIDVINSGGGYSYANVTIGGSGTGCVAKADLVPDSPIPEDPNVTISSHAQATAGSIEFIDIVSAGQNYNDSSKFEVVGDGKGASPIIAVINGQGSIQSIQLGNTGNGYTFAEIISSGDGDGAVFKPIISPIWGHGGNVPTELMASTVGIVVDMQIPYSSVMGDYFIGNDFRQVGVIKNIHAYGVYGEVFQDITGDACYLAGVSDIGNYDVDDRITTDSGGDFYVIEKNPYPYTNTIKLTPFIDSISITSVLTNVNKSLVTAPLQTLRSPEVNKKTGDIIYLKNITPILRQLYQSESVKLFLQF